MDDVNPVTILVAAGGLGGLAAVITAITSSVNMYRQGIAGREDKRREDIIRQREEAWAKAVQADAEAEAAQVRADAERDRRIRWQEEAARLRLQVIKNGGEPGDWPDEDTHPRASPGK